MLAMSISIIAGRAETSLPVLQQRRLEPNDPDPCRGCSDCCEYIAIPISRPRSRSDFDELLWYLLHQNIWIFVDDENDWFVQVNSPCEALHQRRCGIYRRRPHICREYAVDECTRHAPGDPDKHLFRNAEELLAFVARYRPKTYARLKGHYPDGFPSTPDNHAPCDCGSSPALSVQSA